MRSGLRASKVYDPSPPSELGVRTALPMEVCLRPVGDTALPFFEPTESSTLSTPDTIIVFANRARFLGVRSEVRFFSSGADSMQVLSLAPFLQERHGAVPSWTHLTFEPLEVHQLESRHD